MLTFVKFLKLIFFNNNILKQRASAAVYLNKSLLGLKSVPPIPKNQMQQKDLSEGGIKNDSDMFRYKYKEMKEKYSGTRIKEKRTKFPGNTTKYSGTRIKEQKAKCSGNTTKYSGTIIKEQKAKCPGNTTKYSGTRINEQKAKCPGNTTKYYGARIKKRKRNVPEIK